MAIGPGKYDEYCNYVFEKTQAKAAIVVVIDGNKGSGMSANVQVDILLNVPDLLRQVADDMEEGWKQ